MEILLGIIIVLGIGYIVYKKFNKNTASITLIAGDVQGIQTQAISSDVTGVFVNFTQLELQPKEGDRLTFTFDAKVINLMDNTGNELLDGQDVPVGQYNWIRLLTSNVDSYVQVGDVKESLDIPSGEQTGLKLNRGFRVGDDGADFTIDFNLEKSLIEIGNTKGEKFKLKPVLGLVDNLGPIAPIGGSPEPQE